ncbi:MAG: YggT family protein [Candidatus Aminicenantales bacterium]
MIFFANFLHAVARVLHVLLMLYVWIVILRAVLSWVNVPALYQAKVILYYLTEPLLRPFRRIIPPYRLGGIDISPIILILVILFVDSFLVKSISLYARQLLREQTLHF